MHESLERNGQFGSKNRPSRPAREDRLAEREPHDDGLDILGPAFGL
jgi:hypothetical protein